MPLSIEIPDALLARLSAGGLSSEDVIRFAVAALTAIATRAEEQSSDAAAIQAWWNGLTDAEREAETARTLASLTAADAGRVRPALAGFDRRSNIQQGQS